MASLPSTLALPLTSSRSVEPHVLDFFADAGSIQLTCAPSFPNVQPFCITICSSIMLCGQSDVRRAWGYIYRLGCSQY